MNQQEQPAVLPPALKSALDEWRAAYVAWLWATGPAMAEMQRLGDANNDLLAVLVEMEPAAFTTVRVTAGNQ